MGWTVCRATHKVHLRANGIERVVLDLRPELAERRQEALA